MSQGGLGIYIPSFLRPLTGGRRASPWQELPWCMDLILQMLSEPRICVLKHSSGWSFWLLSKRLLPLWPSASTCQKRNRNGHFKAIPWSIPTSNWPFFLFNKSMNQIKLISDSVMLSAVKNNISSVVLCAHTRNFNFKITQDPAQSIFLNPDRSSLKGKVKSQKQNKDRWVCG